MFEDKLFLIDRWFQRSCFKLSRFVKQQKDLQNQNYFSYWSLLRGEQKSEHPTGQNVLIVIENFIVSNDSKKLVLKLGGLLKTQNIDILKKNLVFLFWDS